ncbi:MAG TPA: DinB family protein [Gemmatimonadaceae bacterium]|nr:DinB family protein [Gemmatimonadaceae bacterium]
MMATRQGSTRRGMGGTPSRALLLRALHEIYHGPAWHGSSLRLSLRGVSAADAAWRPAPDRNSIWDVVLHLAYTRHIMLRRLGVKSARAFPHPLRSSWWPRLPDTLAEDTWRADLALLEEYQERLLAAVSAVPAARLATRRRGKVVSLGDEVLGVAHHDAYHTGQIQLLRRLMA